MSSIHVLLVEDSGFMGDLVVDKLESIHEYKVTRVENASEAYDVLQKDDSVSCIVTNYELPGETGLELAEYVNGSPTKINTPIIIFTGRLLEPFVESAINVGVNEFVHKSHHANGQMNILANRIKNMVNLYS